MGAAAHIGNGSGLIPVPDTHHNYTSSNVSFVNHTVLLTEASQVIQALSLTPSQHTHRSIALVASRGHVQSAMPPSKNKRRKPSNITVKDCDGQTDGSQVVLEGSIIRMPVEVLAMILFYVSSPRDVLALARTSKHFCAILVNNKANDFIWRAARAHCHPQPIPDFTPNFTEASFAAFIFDSKTCEVETTVACDQPGCPC